MQDDLSERLGTRVRISHKRNGSGKLIVDYTSVDELDGILERGRLDGYSLAFAALADLCRRLGRLDDARQAYRRALDLTDQEAERRFLTQRLSELGEE